VRAIPLNIMGGVAEQRFFRKSTAGFLSQQNSDVAKLATLWSSHRQCKDPFKLAFTFQIWSTASNFECKRLLIINFLLCHSQTNASGLAFPYPCLSRSTRDLPSVNEGSAAQPQFVGIKFFTESANHKLELGVVNELSTYMKTR